MVCTSLGSLLRPLFYFLCYIHFSLSVQSCVKTFLPGFGNGWLKYCAIVQFWGGQRNILRVILET